jgi:hypothetical protein
MDEWLDLNNFDDWATKLDELIVEADAAAGNSADPANEARRRAAARLRDFKRFSPDQYRLDPIATRALDGLVEATIGDSLRILAEAANELDQFVKPLRAITSESNKRAGWLSLKSPRDIVDRLTDTADAMGSLYETTTDFENADEVKSKLDAALRAIKRLQDEVEKAAGQA